MRHLSPGQQSILFLLALPFILLLYLRFYSNPAPPPPAEFYREIVVEAAGEVIRPGIYLFRDPPSLRETIRRAGGFKEAVPLESLASDVLPTGTRLLVTKEPESARLFSPPGANGKEGSGLSQENRFPVKTPGPPYVIRVTLQRMEARKLLLFSIPLDLNRVTVEDLCFIPGIGKTLAQEIVAYRVRRNAFRSVEDLKNVKGIGEKRWKGLRTFFVVDASPPKRTDPK